MQTTLERTDTHTVRLTIEVPADEFGKDLDRTYRAIADQVRIPGFRKGKVPKPVIDAQIGRDAVLEEFVNSTVPTYFRQAVNDEDLAPIGDPDIDLEQLEPGKPLIFSATVEVRPRLELAEADFTGVHIERPPVEVTEADVDEWIERLRQRFAELEPVERPVQEGDFATINLTVKRGGDVVEQATREDYLYAVGSGEFGVALDKELTGTRPGAILNVVDTLPERFGGELTSGPVTMTVLVKDVKGMRLPDVDDGFATTASEFDTIEQLRDDLRTRLRELKVREAQGVLRDRALQAMIDRVEVELPESLIEEETNHRVLHAEEQAQRVGMTLDQMLETQGWDRNRLSEDSRAHAIRAIKGDLVLEGVARAAGLQVTAEEIGAEISTLAQAYGRDPKDVAKSLERSGQIVTLAGDIIRTKALDLLVERADIHESGSADAAGTTEGENES